MLWSRRIAGDYAASILRVRLRYLDGYRFRDSFSDDEVAYDENDKSSYTNTLEVILL